MPHSHRHPHSAGHHGDAREPALGEGRVSPTCDAHCRAGRRDHIHYSDRRTRGAYGY